MLEIYNESVFDLLGGKDRKALKIRQSKQRGFFGWYLKLLLLLENALSFL